MAVKFVLEFKDQGVSVSTQFTTLKEAFAAFQKTPSHCNPYLYRYKYGSSELLLAYKISNKFFLSDKLMDILSDSRLSEVIESNNKPART